MNILFQVTLKANEITGGTQKVLVRGEGGVILRLPIQAARDLECFLELLATPAKLCLVRT